MNNNYPQPENNVFINDDHNENFNFKNLNVRLNFIKKVYSIVLVQLSITSAMIALVMINKQAFIKFYVEQIWLAIICAIVSIVCLYALSCYQSIARKVPLNYILLMLFTVTFSYGICAFVLRFSVTNVLIAAVLTAFTTLGLTVYAFKTKTDFTTCGALFFGLAFALLGMAIITIITRSYILYQIYCFFGLAVYCLYLIYDTQLLMEPGKRKYTLEIDDYIFAAMNIYIDIIEIFLYILRILGNASNN